MNKFEQQVSDYWNFARCYDSDPLCERFTTYRVKCGPVGGIVTSWFDTPDQAWKDAWKQTEKHTVEVEDLKEEIDVLCSCHRLPETLPIYKRILIREETLLTLKKLGMK